MFYSRLELGPIETGGHVVVCRREGGREGKIHVLTIVINENWPPVNNAQQ